MKRKLLKKYKKKRGFTLIELLAVILILGIIALIAIPTVTSVVEQSRRGAAEQSVTTFVKAVEELTLSKDLSGEKIVDGDYLIEEVIELGLELKGTMPDSGSVTIVGNEVVSCQIISGNYLVTCKENGEKEVSKVDTNSFTPAENSSYLGMVYYNPNEGKKCTKTDFESNLASYDTTKLDSNGNKFQDGLKTGCMIWYIYKDNEDGTVNMLLNHNITSDSSYSISTLASLTSEWKNTADFMSMEDVAKIIKVDQYLKFDLSKPYLNRLTVDKKKYISYFMIDYNNYTSFIFLNDIYDYVNETNPYKYFWLIENFYSTRGSKYLPKVKSKDSFSGPDDQSVCYYLKEKVNYTIPEKNPTYWAVGCSLYNYIESDSRSIHMGLIGPINNRTGFRPVITINKSIYE